MRWVVSFCLTIFLFGGCTQPPDFPDTPKIKFLSLEETDEDLLTLKFEFEDGDANPGLATTQTSAPFHEYNYITINGDTLPPSRVDDFVIDSVKNIYFSNTILYTYLLVEGEFQKAFYGIDLINGDTIERPDVRFPPVTQKVNGQPVSGTIEVDINTRFFSALWLETDTLRFEFYVFDRDLQRSNTIVTTPFTVFP